jgi:hypothetical protein
MKAGVKGPCRCGGLAGGPTWSGRPTWKRIRQRTSLKAAAQQQYRNKTKVANGALMSDLGRGNKLLLAKAGVGTKCCLRKAVFERTGLDSERTVVMGTAHDVDAALHQPILPADYWSKVSPSYYAKHQFCCETAVSGSALRPRPTARVGLVQRRSHSRATPLARCCSKLAPS